MLHAHTATYKHTHAHAALVPTPRLHKHLCSSLNGCLCIAFIPHVASPPSRASFSVPPSTPRRNVRREALRWARDVCCAALCVGPLHVSLSVHAGYPISETQRASHARANS